MKPGDMLIGYDNGSLQIGIIISHSAGDEYRAWWYDGETDELFEGFADRDYLVENYDYEFISI